MANLLFRELRAKKAKFGFVAHINTNNMAKAGATIKEVELRDPAAFAEFLTNMGASDLKIYTDRPDVAEFVRCITD